MPTVKSYQKQKEKEQIAYNYFLSQGYSPEASAGIVGNLVYESGLNTKAEGDIGYSGGSSFGIAQFRGQRLKNLKNRYGNNWTDFNNQLDFVRHELETTHQKANNVLRNTRDVYEAGRAFSDLYEIPAKKYKDNKDRQKKVNNVYNSWSGQKYEPIATPISDEAIRNVNQYFSENPTIAVTDLEIQEDNSNLAEKTEEKPEKDKDTEEVEKQTAEYNFLQDYKNIVNTPQQTIAQIEEPVQQYQPQNLTDIYNQVSNFIDTDIAQQGGRIYVGSQSDPRYKAYLDSLGLYQGTQRTIQEINSKRLADEGDVKIGYVPVNDLNKEKGQALVGFGNNRRQQGDWYLTYDKEFNKEQAKKYLNDVDIKPEKFYKSLNGSTYYRPIYKKPQEEVIVRAKESIIPLDNSIQSQGLVSVTPNTSFSEAEILNQYIQPKYWDVQDTVNQNFGGTQTNYRVTPQNADYTLRTIAPEPYNSRRVTPYFQTGGDVQSSKDFLSNWYENRVLPDPALNQTYQNEKQQFVNQSMYLPNPKYVSTIDSENTQGEYIPETNEIQLSDSASPYAYTHEASHKIFTPLTDTQSGFNAFQFVGENITPQENISNQWVKDNYQQISNYQEILPRLNAYRQKYNLQPDQIITPELIQRNRQEYLNTNDYEDNTDQLYKLFEDANLADTLNKVVSVDNLSNNTYAQQGSKVYNPNLSLNKEFQKWYKNNTVEGKNEIPYSDKLDYDYLSFFMNGDYKKYTGGHFPDTYKRTNHETFSNESIYSTPEKPGGYWKGENYYNTGKFIYQNGGIIKDQETEEKNDLVEVKESSIQGKGIFVKKNLGKGEFIGLAHTNDQPSTELGRMHNHSDTPNAESVKDGNNRYLVSLKPLKKGEEVTVDYRKQPELEQPEDFIKLTENEKEFLKHISQLK